MTTNKVQLRQRRHIRIKNKISGTTERPRLVVSRSLLHIYAQLIDDTKGLVLAQASDMKSKVEGSKIERAKDVGTQIAKLASEKKITTVVFDRNGHKYHGRVKALADGAREGGLKF